MPVDDASKPKAKGRPKKSDCKAFSPAPSKNIDLNMSKVFTPKCDINTNELNLSKIFNTTVKSTKSKEKSNLFMTG